MKKALIIGITGQDGAYLSNFLLKKGYKVYGTYRRNSSPNFWRLKALGILNKVTLISADITDSPSLTEAVKISNPDEIYNLAAQSNVGASFDQPYLTAQVNGIGIIHLLEIVRSRKKTKLYQASTSELYGDSGNAKKALNEEDVFMPNSPYAASKLYAFHMSRIYRDSYNIFVSNGILFNHESPLRGVEFLTRKTTNAVARIKLGLQKKLYLGNLESYRDWGFAPDYVESMWLMLQQDHPDDFVISTGKAYQVKDFVKEAFSSAGLDWKRYVKVQETLKRPKDVIYLRGDYSKAKKLLGWEPRTEFKELVAKMVKADLLRWDQFITKGKISWDAPNYSEDLNVISRTREKK